MAAASQALDFGTFFSRDRVGVGKANVVQGLRLEAHSVPGIPRAIIWRFQPSSQQLSREREGARVCLAGPVTGRRSRAQDSSPFLPHLLPGSLLGAGKGDRAGGGWVRRLCLCKSACCRIHGPLCILCDCRAQLSMAPLCLGLSLHICSMSPPALPPLGGQGVREPRAARQLSLARTAQSLGHTSVIWP